MKKSSSHFMIHGVDELLQQVGQNIKIARVRRRITIKELASRVHVDERTISRMEKGDSSINFKNLVSVLIVLNIADSVTALAHPDHDDIGKALDFQKHPKRVRTFDKLSDDF
ncbi:MULTISPECIES: helix-turn-helix domain-containing protein [Acinetobacter]|uniref:helix-turn-helix domain-containing protein n=1 Tax=Acinetobacter TaxID=469 RepID=UPI000CEB3EA6|nr:helix-turn-helix transcriptional regulator [Acinetobacter indicus]AVH15321.1 XRE family transcriptional regulator [Acinetobacter indicus]